MKCPKCGSENPPESEFCTLCLERLQSSGTGPSTYRRTAPGERYVAPGEWRGEAEAMRSPVRMEVRRKVRAFRFKMVGYGFLLAAFSAWLILSFTVWGNPSPGRRAMQYIEALNRRDAVAAQELVLPSKHSEGERLYRDLVYYLGDTGRFENVEFEVMEQDVYSSQAYLVRGSIVIGTENRAIAEEDGLVIYLQNRGGKWYIDPSSTVLVPFR